MHETSIESWFNRQSVYARIKLAPGETENGRFKSWLAEICLEPRHCHTHPKIRLVLDRRESSIKQAFKGDEEGHQSYGREPEIEPGTFHFTGVMRCPACRCAAAHCPPAICESTFETFDISTPEREKAVARCREFAAQVNQHGRGFALFVGPTGVGKTRLAVNIVGELETFGVLYVRQAQLTEALRATYGNGPVNYNTDGRRIEPDHPLEVAQGATVLVLDEIGCGPLANDERLLLDELIKHRYDQAKPTILISNLALDQLKEYLGDALTDRVRHATGNGKFILQFSDESYRRNGGDNYLEGPG